MLATFRPIPYQPVVRKSLTCHLFLSAIGPGQCCSLQPLDFCESNQVAPEWTARLAQRHDPVPCNHLQAGLADSHGAFAVSAFAIEPSHSSFPILS